MKLTRNILVAGVLMTALPITAIAQDGTRYEPVGQAADRVLSQSEIDDLIARAREQGVAVTGSPEVRYVGGSQTAIETVQCCENVEEQVTERNEVKDTTTYFDAVTAREIIQPVQRTLIQPIEHRTPNGHTETVTEDMRIEEERLPVRIDRDPVPQTVVNNIPQERTETRDEVTETTYDVVGRREVTQPVERTTVIPVQRRITRPRIETVTADTRYETREADLQVQADPVPQVVETVTPQVTTETRDEVTETTFDYVAQRDIIQPVTRVIIQPVEHQILQGTTETVTADTQYVEERLPVRVETEPAPAVEEVFIPQVTERTVFEVEDVYIDQITRNIIQPVVITTVQPVEHRLVNGRTETVTAPVQYEEERLAGRVETDPTPETVVNYIPQEQTENREEYTETYFEAVTQRDVIQPIVRTLVQPVEIRRPSIRTESVTAPVRYETVRASLVVLNMGGGCNCN